VIGKKDLLVSAVGFKAAQDIGKTSKVVTARCSPHHTALTAMVIIAGYKKDTIGVSCNLPNL
jgi:hypothetical protein